VVVVAREDHVTDAALAQSQQHGGRLGREARINDQRERRKQHAQPLDLLGAGRSVQERVHHGELHRSAADRGERFAPVERARQGEPRRGGAAQLVELDVGNGSENQHSVAKAPFNAAKTP